MDVDVLLKLPEELVERAKEAGVLTDERIAAMIEAEIKREFHLRRFKETVEQLRDLQPPMTQEEIDEELEAYRTEQRTHRD